MVISIPCEVKHIREGREGGVNAVISDGREI
jgi:hypothetical protein